MTSFEAYLLIKDVWHVRPKARPDWECYLFHEDGNVSPTSLVYVEGSSVTSIDVVFEFDQWEIVK